MHPQLDESFMRMLRRRAEVPIGERADIERKIWAQHGVKCAVMITDMTGFSEATAEHGILHFLSFIERKIRLSIPIIDATEGRLVKTIGDDLFCVFPDATKAAQAAIQIMEAVENDNHGRPMDEQFSTAIGLGYGPMLTLGGRDFFGDEVNRASKLGEDLASPKQILVTSDFKQACETPNGWRFESRNAEISGVSLPHFECVRTDR